MIIDENILKDDEIITFKLRSLYSDNGYRQFKMSKFEEYDLYMKNKDFLISDGIITFNDTNGKLLALKPDVTLSIVKNSKDIPGCVQKLYYNENVYRVSGSSHTYKEIMQTGLECIGDISDSDTAEVVRLADESARLISGDYHMAVSHIDFVSRFLADYGIDADFDKEICNAFFEKNSDALKALCTDKQCKFIDYLLDNSPEKAKEIYDVISEKYPVFVTRDFEKAKQWVRKQVRGSQRSGVLACSSAQRLKPEGIYVPTDIDVKNWFLAPSDDLRSSNKLEIVASEFKVQGLEIDWGIVCWDADLRRNSKNNDWDHYSFRGTKWMHRNKPEQQRYLVNSYRVLLTRARQGMVLFVPKGVDPEEDPTRDAKYYDDIYKYLIKCGTKVLTD